jgi:parvulin-like peptidyl-prolyl isomerase
MMLRRAAAVTMVLAVMSAVAVHGQGEVIDRVLAVVAGDIITQSDVDGAIALGLAPTDGTQDRRGAALQRLIDRELALREVRRYLPPEPDPVVVEERLETIRRRFPSAAAFEQTLALSATDDARVREMIRDDLRIRAYTDERFGASPEPSDEELTAYYQEHLSDFTRAGRVQSLADARAEVRRRLEASRYDMLVRDWLAGLRRRAEITVLYLAGS